VGYPEGAPYEQSTDLHLIDCYPEMKADRKLRGAEREEKVMNPGREITTRGITKL
jgi:hypothetical protein